MYRLFVISFLKQRARTTLFLAFSFSTSVLIDIQSRNVLKEHECFFNVLIESKFWFVKMKSKITDLYNETYKIYKLCYPHLSPSTKVYNKFYPIWKNRVGIINGTDNKIKAAEIFLKECNEKLTETKAKNTLKFVKVIKIFLSNKFYNSIFDFLANLIGMKIHSLRSNLIEYIHLNLNAVFIKAPKRSI